MKLYMIQQVDGTAAPAVEKQGRLYLLRDAGADVPDLPALIRSPQAMEKIRSFLSEERSGMPSFDPGSVRILSPIIHPQQAVVCLGLNYREHIDETTHVEDFTHKEATVYFAKTADRISGPGDPIPWYDFVDSLDYEVELAAVLGRDIRNYKAATDPDPVFGYSVFNDVSARNLQFRHKQWFLGKSLDGYSVMGPCLVTADEIGDAGHLEIVCEVNGEVRQKSNTANMICTVHEALEELSQGMTLRAGTVLASGTPGGVALGMAVPRYLKRGDRVRCRIEKIGTLENPVV